ncbi:MAG: chromosome partition protein MukB [Syntrophobacteraceae bacterium]|nr:chromosome partition protein MukB [Syntrophobacteraceae bacterium]
MKSNRTRIESLVLINWNGFFFQRFEMDETVTALEGENGAGKTTVMIAAFVALLPDQRLLQFRNVSDGGAVEGDRGLFGRLGARGVAYTILELGVQGGQRMLAGVMVRKKTPPGLELTPFIVEGLPADMSLQQALLIRENDCERVAELFELSRSLGQSGASFQVCDSVGQYTARLFELGITPMRMESYAEREKFNRMLQTSMYGGLSGSIQKGLRNYLLAEDQSLRNHVARMRDNLDACRLTRREIASAESKYQVIEGIFKAGFAMLESAFQGARLRLLNLRRIADGARAEHLGRKAELNALQMVARELERKHGRLTSELEEKQRERAKAEDIARERRQALKIALEIEKVSSGFDAAKEELRHSERKVEDLEKRYQKLQTKVDALSAQRDQAAEGLSDVSKAWEQISRNVALFKLARQSLEDCQKALPGREVDARSAPALLEECRAAWGRALETKTRVHRELESLDTRIRGYEETIKALRSASGKSVSRENGLETAKELEDEFRNMEMMVREAANISEQLRRAVKRGERQQEVRKKASFFENMGEKAAGAQGLRSLFESLQKELTKMSEERSSLQERLATLREEKALLEQQIGRLGPEALEWKQARAIVGKLEAGLLAKITDGPSLDSLDSSARADLETVRGKLRLLHKDREATLSKISELEFGGGRLDEALVRLRDLVDGALAAELYDDTPQAEAPALEARLGPLLGALLVEDIPQAAEIISREPDRPEHVWLIEAGTLKGLPEGKPYPAAELVKMGDAWRLSRHPERPAVGRAARELEVERLRAYAESLRAETQTARSEEARLLEGLEKIGLLRRHYRFLGSPDPAEAIARLRERLGEIDSLSLPAKKRVEEIATLTRRQGELAKELAPILPDADLLDEQDWLEKSRELKTRLKGAETARTCMESIRAAMDRVRGGMYELENPPPAPEALAELKEELSKAESVLEYWSRGRELLVTLIDRLPHLKLGDQEKVLGEHQSVFEELKNQKRVLDSDLEDARRVLGQADLDYRGGREEFNSFDAKAKGLFEKLENLKIDLESTGQDGSSQSLEEAENFREASAAELKAAQKAERGVGNDLIRAEKDMETGSNRVFEARGKRKKCLKDLLPHFRAWMSLQRGIRRAGLLDRLMEPSVLSFYENKTAAQAFEDASRRQGELKNILKTIPEAAELRQELEKLFETRDSDLRRGFLILEAWLLTCQFLERSTPRDIAQADDPEIAVKQIGGYLLRLREKLDDQQRQLRQRSDSVANSIRNRIRTEERQVHQLNRRLEAVSFGTIAGIRIYLDRVESMQRLLSGLQVQKELFNSHISLEEAMSELYRQVGGGQIRGDQLLDYREYVRMSAEVRRFGSDKWIRASSSTLSTGESIGVGAAVLMVILDAWEHQAVLFRGKREVGSMRFLFLDEAARLSPKSFDTLGEFCERMDLQLLVAAPSADRARRGTAYRLVRGIDDSGAEEVVVRGRRFTGRLEEEKSSEAVSG